MTTFKDRFRNEWDCKITMETAMRLNRWDFSQVYDRPVNLYAPDEQLLKDLTLNAGLLIALVYAICKPTIDERYKDVADVSTDGSPSPRELQFLRGIDGEAIENARTAIFEALADFFPTKRTAILDALNRPRQAEKEMETLMKNRDTELTAIMKQKSEAYVEKMMKQLHETDVETLLENDGKLS
ncbi:MAG: hypothetical protein Q4D62_12450 [Planctomycetia bacterium]|nr:hypothetical protein [Planctomycetia bacterium]